jgi:uncharacterized glyoxalase superfamily protein PhnB
MSNLENLRKQAKRYLRWHRDGYYPVAAHIRAVLPRFATFSDREILRQPFRLGDAQELVARQSGFESWRALKEGTQIMPAQPNAKPATGDLRTPYRPVLLYAEPTLFVTGTIEGALDYYAEKLGFRTVLVYGDPAYFAQASRDGVRLNLRFVHKPVLDRTGEPDLLQASIHVADVKALFLEYQAAGVTLAQTLMKSPWGTSGFIIEDPYGNLIGFGEKSG